LTELNLRLDVQDRNGIAHAEADNVLRTSQKTSAEQINELKKDTRAHAISPRPPNK
jgi:hypothetical protein